MRSCRKRKRLKADNVGEYLASVPEDARTALGKLRRMIKSAAPKAAEVISYQIPTYRHHGPLVGFAAFEDHLSLFVMSPKLIRALTKELAGYEVNGATVHLRADKPLPAALVKRLVKARIAENDQRLKK